MKNKVIQKFKNISVHTRFLFFICFSLILVFLFIYFPGLFGFSITYNNKGELKVEKSGSTGMLVLPLLDVVAYENKINELANRPGADVEVVPTAPDGSQKTSAGEGLQESNIGTETLSTGTLWPAKTVYPNAGAILPFNRIIAYYGNLYSRKMGILGEYPETEMLARLDAEVKKWEEADPNTPVVPALHYIALVAQASAGADGKYRARMPSVEIDKVITMAEKINALVFLDIQVGFSDVQTEVPVLEKYLKMPNVHLGIDPEFSMKSGIRPGKVVGTYDATDVNWIADYLAKIVKENDLTPKILVIHRYTQKMLTNYQLIKPLPEVQIVVHMDGWGGAAKKISTYQQFIYKEPIQFTGFKLFYKNDVFDPGTILMTPDDLLKLQPRPIYIQYQ